MIIRNVVIADTEGDVLGDELSWVWIEKGVIRRVGREEEFPEGQFPVGQEHFDGKGMILLPGMNNAHYHSYTNIVKGFSDGEPLEVWSQETIALGASLTEEEAALSAQTGICEMLHLGITGCLDHIPHLPMTRILGETYRKAGFRAALAPMIHNLTEQEYLWGMREEERTGGRFLTPEGYRDYYGEIRDSFHEKDLLTVQVGLNSPQRCTDELLEAAGRIAHELDLNVHSHLLESRWQAGTASGSGRCPVKAMKKYGLLTERTSLAHCVWLTEEQRRLIAGSGARMVINSSSNLFIGSGVAPVWEYEEMGIPFCFGSDGENCACSMNLLEELRFSLLYGRTLSPGSWMDLKGAWRYVSGEGAAVTGSAKENSSGGRIVPGAKADLIFVDRGHLGLWPENRGMFQILFHTPYLNPAHVIIGGKWVMKNGRILTIDEEALKKKLHDTKEERLKRLQKAAEGTEERKAFFRARMEELRIL